MGRANLAAAIVKFPAGNGAFGIKGTMAALALQVSGEIPDRACPELRTIRMACIHPHLQLVVPPITTAYLSVAAL